MSNILVSTSDNIAGYETKEYKGIVWGATVRAKNIGQDFLAACKNITGGESAVYTQLQEETRQQALDRLMAHCEKLGGNAVISIRFETGSSVQGFIEVLAYGTAVVVEKK